ncbi:MAG TPA: hypothetical protein VHQ98_00480 [Gaiellaceae bacterium]|jgi:hypothetical protein|nr:hypothetical protein [Gaiellaceae bacterium]
MAVEEYAGASGEQEMERRPSLVSLLVEAGVASEDQLQLALAEGLATGERLGEVVVRKGLIDQVGLARILARQWRLPFLDDAEAQPKRQLSPGFAAARAVELRACPITGGGATALVAVAEPSEERFTAARGQLGAEVAFVVVAEATLERLFQQLEGDGEGERAEAAVMVGVAGAVAAEERERPLQQLLGELELASERLAELRARAEQLLRQHEQTQAELDASHRELEQLQGQRRQDQSTIAHLERQLAEERQRLDAVKAKIGELSETLTDA